MWNKSLLFFTHLVALYRLVERQVDSLCYVKLLRKIKSIEVQQVFAGASKNQTDIVNAAKFRQRTFSINISLPIVRRRDRAGTQ